MAVAKKPNKIQVAHDLLVLAKNPSQPLPTYLRQAADKDPRVDAYIEHLKELGSVKGASLDINSILNLIQIILPIILKLLPILL